MKATNLDRLQSAAATVMALFAVLTIGASFGHAAKPGWQNLGRKQASFTRDHDVIKVKGPADSYRALKFRAIEAPLDLRRIIVTYDNRTEKNLDVRQNIPQGGESRPIDLRGGKRSIRRVELWYDTKGLGRGKADVTLFGRN